MSQGILYERSVILEKAEALRLALAPYCERIEIAGSIRREKKQSRDIDLVVIWQGGGFGLLKVYLENKKRMSLPTGGEKIIKFTWMGVPVQISVATPETWPVILLIRTGPADFNIYLCTTAKKRNMKLEAAGYIVKSDMRQAVETERDIFKVMGLDYIEPKDRK